MQVCLLLACVNLLALFMSVAQACCRFKPTDWLVADSALPWLWSLVEQLLLKEPMTIRWLA